MSEENNSTNNRPVFAVQQMFWEVMRLRTEMSVAKLGYFLTGGS